MILGELRYLKKELSTWVGKCFTGLFFLFGAWVGFLPFKFFLLVVLPIVLAISVLPWLVVTVMIYWKERGTERVFWEFLGGLIVVLFHVFVCLLVYPIMWVCSFFVFKAVCLFRDVIGLVGEVNSELFGNGVMIAAAFLTGMIHSEIRAEINQPNEVRELKERIKELEGKSYDSDSD